MDALKIKGKLLQLKDLPPRLWPAFIGGWLKRKSAGVVPCAIPLLRKMVQVPIASFYKSYFYFCERSTGRQEIRFFLSQLKTEEQFIDVGAFCGAFSVFVSQAVRGASKIIAVEALAENVRNIQNVICCNGLTNIEIVESIVGDGSGSTLSFETHDDMLRLGDAQANKSSREIFTAKLDDLLAARNVVPTLIKMDVEGYEYKVLQGMENILSVHKPRIFMEVHSEFLANQGLSDTRVLDCLKNHGYTLTVLDENDLTNNTYHLWCEPGEKNSQGSACA